MSAAVRDDVAFVNVMQEDLMMVDVMELCLFLMR